MEEKKIVFNCKTCGWTSDPIEWQQWMFPVGNICPNCGNPVNRIEIEEETTEEYIEFTPDFEVAWDKGAYIAKSEPKLHKPISPPPPKESTVESTYYVCRNCIYCMRAEFPTYDGTMLQWICKKYPVKGELISQEPPPDDIEQANDLIDIDINWCGKGEWIVEEELISLEDIVNEIKEEDSEE